MTGKLGYSAVGWLAKKLFPPVLLLVVFGCSDQRQQIADLISPPKPGEVAARVDGAVAQNQGKLAIEIGESFLKSAQDPQGLVHQSLVNAYLSIGDAASAHRHLEVIAGNGGAVAVSISLPSNEAAPSQPAAPTAPMAPTAPTAPKLPTAINATPVSGTDGASVSSGVSESSITYQSNTTITQSGNAVIKTRQ